MSTPATPQVVGLAALAAPLGVVALVLATRRLGQARPLVVAAGRMVVQLVALGFVLKWVFGTVSAWVVAGVGLLMLAVSAGTVGARQRRGGWRLRAEVMGALALCVLVVMGLALKVALGMSPWYRAEVVIPLLGMLLGNSVNGVALAAERLDADLRRERDRVELRLALGATTRQAVHEPMRAAVAAGLTPTINGMAIAGIVAIPGMMTGQLLAGSDVGVALRYQMMIYLGIAGTVGLSVLLILALRLRHYVTPDGRLRVDRLDERGG